MQIIKKNLFTALFACLVLISTVGLSACAQAPSQSPTLQAPAQIEVGMAINLSEGARLGVVDFAVPDNGIMFSNSAQYDEGVTVLDVLKSLDAEYTLNAVLSGEGSSAYLTALYGIEAGLAGANSGWTYTVNGEMALEGIGALALNDGDRIEFSYIVFEF